MSDDILEMTLQREPSVDGNTFGELLIDGQHFCWTLEDEVREIPDTPVDQWKIPGETAIPRGRYHVVMDMSARFGKVMPHVLNVPGFDGIRIHAGNTNQDTSGCILLGKERSPNGLLRSREAMADFYARFQEPAWIIIA